MLQAFQKRRFAALLLLLSAWLYVQPLAAQNKTLTMEDAFLNRTLVPANLKQLSWIPNSDDYAYLKTDDKKDKLVRGTAGKKKEDDILKLDDFLKSVGHGTAFILTLKISYHVLEIRLKGRSANNFIKY